MHGCVPLSEVDEYLDKHEYLKSKVEVTLCLWVLGNDVQADEHGHEAQDEIERLVI